MRVVPLYIIGFVLAEIWAFIEAGRYIGAGLVVLLVVASMIAGWWVIRRQGLKMLGSLQSALRGERSPRDPPAGSLLVLIAGLLLILPGLISDLIALALLVPLSRRIILRELGRRIHFDETHVRWHRGAARAAPMIEGEAVEITPDPPAPNSPWSR